jgi:hypothetical protein
MAKVLFPDFVESFVATTGTFLSRFQLELHLKDEGEASQTRLYEVEASDGPVTVIVHRTARSFEDAIVPKLRRSGGVALVGRENQWSRTAGWRSA